MRTLVALGVALATLSSTSGFVERLDEDHQPLRRDFDARKGRARLVAVLSPT